MARSWRRGGPGALCPPQGPACPAPLGFKGALGGRADQQEEILVFFEDKWKQTLLVYFLADCAGGSGAGGRVNSFSPGSDCLSSAGAPGAWGAAFLSRWGAGAPPNTNQSFGHKSAGAWEPGNRDGSRRPLSRDVGAGLAPRWGALGVCPTPAAGRSCSPLAGAPGTLGWGTPAAAFSHDLTGRAEPGGGRRSHCQASARFGLSRATPGRPLASAPPARRGGRGGPCLGSHPVPESSLEIPAGFPAASGCRDADEG